MLLMRLNPLFSPPQQKYCRVEQATSFNFFSVMASLTEEESVQMSSLLNKLGVLASNVYTLDDLRALVAPQEEKMWKNVKVCNIVRSTGYINFKKKKEYKVICHIDSIALRIFPTVCVLFWKNSYNCRVY